MTPLSDQEYFSKFLRERFEGKKINVFQLAGDASARKYYRIHVGEDQTFVLMAWEPFEDPETYPFLNVLKHFSSNGVQVPKCISYSNKEGLVLLEDLGDLTLERKFWENANPEDCHDFYKLSLDELLKMHYAASENRSADCVAFKVMFDTEKLLWEMNYAKEHLLEKLFRINLGETEKASLRKAMGQICERLHQEPKYIAHRDYHSRNIMIKAGKTRIIDFQDARMGAIQYDLVSLLRDSYVNINEKMESTLLKYYLEGRKRWEPGAIDQEKFKAVFELQTIQRCFKACGSFASFFNMRGDKRYLKYIPGTLKRVNKSLEQFKEYGELKKILDHHGVFEKDISQL